MSRKLSSDLKSINTPDDQQKERRAPVGEAFETLDRNDQAILTASGGVQYQAGLPTKATVQHITTRGDSKYGTPICRKQVEVKTDRVDTLAQKFLVEDVLTTHKT